MEIVSEAISAGTVNNVVSATGVDASFAFSRPIDLFVVNAWC